MATITAKAARWVVLTALFIIPFLGLYVADSLYFPFITGKGFAFRILVEAALAGYAVLALIEPKYRPKFSWTAVLFGAFVLWMIVADALAVSPLKAFWSNFERMEGWVTIIHLFIFFVIAGSVFAADKLWRNWWLTFLGGSALVSLYGLGQLTGIFQIHQGGVRLDATLGNAEYLAAYLIFAIAIALWQAIESKGWLRYTLYVLAAFEAVILFYTATRGAILGLIGAIVLGSLLWLFEAGKEGRKKAYAALAVVVVVVGGVFLLRHTSFVQNDPTLGRLASISAADGQTRFAIWDMAWKGFLARPVTGWGQEGFNYVFNTYYDPSLYGQESWFDRAHNVFLDWLVAGGLPALLLFLALLISAVVAFYRNNVSRAERVILISTLAAYAFQGLFVFDNIMSYIPLIALLAVAHSASARPIAKFESFPAVKSDSGQTTTAVVAFVVFAVICWYVNIPNIAAAQDLIVALTPAADPSTNLAAFKKTVADNSFAFQEISEQLVTYSTTVSQSQSVSPDTKSAFTSYAVQEMGQEAQDRPQDARILLEYALAYSANGDLSDAIKQTTAALALSPEKQQIMIQRGTLEWQAGDTADAKTDFVNAYNLAPGYDAAAEYAAAGDIITGDLADGESLLQSHFGTTTVDSDVLLLAYYQAKQYAPMFPILSARVQNSDTLENVYQLATVYVTAGDPTDARAVLEAYATTHPSDADTVNQLLSQIK